MNILPYKHLAWETWQPETECIYALHLEYNSTKIHKDTHYRNKRSRSQSALILVAFLCKPFKRLNPFVFWRHFDIMRQSCDKTPSNSVLYKQFAYLSRKGSNFVLLGNSSPYNNLQKVFCIGRSQTHSYHLYKNINGHLGVGKA